MVGARYVIPGRGLGGSLVQRWLALRARERVLPQS